MTASKPRVALVFPAHRHPGSFFGYLLPPLGLERLAAAIEDLAEVAVYDARFEPDLIAEVARFRPDVVGVSVKSTMHAHESYAAADALRAALPAATVVIGGLHATSMPEEALEHADFVVCGEGETPFRQLVAGDAPEGIRGLAFMGPGGLVRNPLAPPKADLDGLRPPARHLRPARYRYAAAELIPMDLLETSRGCTHACSFCSPASVYPHKWRAHSVPYVMAEITRLAEAGVKICMLTDDHLGGDMVRLEALADAILASGVRMAFFCFIRAFTGHVALKRKLVQAGFVFVTYGAESPSPEQLKRYNKGYPTASGAFLKQVNAEWREAGALYVGNSYVFGDVNETAESLEALGAYARSLDPTYIEPLYAQPYPATRYRAELVAADLVRPRPWSDYTEGRLLVRHPELEEEELRRLRARTWVDFFSPRKATGGTLAVPLYLHHVLGVDVPTVLRFMAASDYALFGCFLEDQFYEDLRPEMVLDWFERALPSFEPEERCMTEHVDAFADMLGLGPLKRLLGTCEVVLAVRDAGATVASVVFPLVQGRVVDASVEPGDWPSRPGVRRWSFQVPLQSLAALAAPGPVGDRLMASLRSLPTAWR